MKNFIKTGVAVATISLLAACGSTPEKNPMAGMSCTYNDGKTEAPEFFCNDIIDGFPVVARGSYEKSAAGMNFMEQQAALAARQNLAQSVATQISGLVKNFLSTTGKGDSETVDAAASNTVKSVTDTNLMGTRIVRRHVGPEGELYVWVGIDQNNLVVTTQNAIRTSMNNEKALWQKFQSDKSFEELGKELEEYRKMQQGG